MAITKYHSICFDCLRSSEFIQQIQQKMVEEPDNGILVMVWETGFAISTSIQANVFNGQRLREKIRRKPSDK